MNEMQTTKKKTDDTDVLAKEGKKTNPRTFISRLSKEVNRKAHLRMMEDLIKRGKR
jgi:hypothetical protein